MLTYLITHLLTCLIAYLLTYLLTYCMEQSPSWETNRFSGSQKIRRIVWNPKVRYRIHKCRPPLRILSQLDPVHTHTSHFPTIHFNIIFPSTSGSSKWSLTLRCPNQNPVYTSPLPHTCYMTSLYHSSRFCHPKNTGWGVQIIKLLIRLLAETAINCGSVDSRCRRFQTGSDGKGCSLCRYRIVQKMWNFLRRRRTTQK